MRARDNQHQHFTPSAVLTSHTDHASPPPPLLFQDMTITSGDISPALPVGSALQCAALCADPARCSAALLTPLTSAGSPEAPPAATDHPTPRLCRLVRPGQFTITVGGSANDTELLLLPVE